MFRLTPIQSCSKSYIDRFEDRLKRYTHFIYLDTAKAYKNSQPEATNIDELFSQFKDSKYAFIGGNHWGPGFYHAIMNRVDSDTIEILKLISDSHDFSFDNMLSVILLSAHHYNYFQPQKSISKLRFPKKLLINNFDKNFGLRVCVQSNVLEYFDLSS